MRNHGKGLFVFGLLTLSLPSYGQAVDINSLHYSQAAKQTRMVFDVSASPKHRVFVKNSQLVIDIKNAKLEQALTQPSASHPLFAKIHVLEKTKDNVRLAIDLKKPITAKNFSLSSNNKDEHKLIIDLISKNTAITADNKEIASKSTAEPSKKEALEHKTAPVAPPAEPTNMFAVLTGKNKPAELQAVAQQVSSKHDKIVIAIDPGHGGQDPGAHGTNGTEEKQVVFAIASKLAKLINSQPDMKAIMVRKGDYYVGLRKECRLPEPHTRIYLFPFMPMRSKTPPLKVHRFMYYHAVARPVKQRYGWQKVKMPLIVSVA